MSIQVRCFNIKWDTDGEEVDLPKEYVLEVSEDNEDEISDALSDQSGWCHQGFEYEVINAETLAKRATAKGMTGRKLAEKVNEMERENLLPITFPDGVAEDTPVQTIIQQLLDEGEDFEWIESLWD